MESAIVAAWRTNARATDLLVRGLPPALLNEKIPGAPTRTVRMIAAHLHNARARWIRTLGTEHGIHAPRLVNPRTVPVRELLTALKQSAAGIEALLELGVAHGGEVPSSTMYVWRNLPLDVGHVLAYFVAHEAHHRGQLVLVARQMGRRLDRDITDGIWQWTRLSRSRSAKASRSDAPLG
jgi:uncharacterized damage-inducible protein DinB